MSTLVIDASVAIKWVIEEEGTEAAISLRRSSRLIAPEFLLLECANVLWRKGRRRELSGDEAVLAMRILATSNVELFPLRNLFDHALALSFELDHPAYDCIYLALAVQKDVRLVTADTRLLGQLTRRNFSSLAVSLDQAERPS